MTELFALDVLTDRSDERINLHGYFDSDHLDDFVREAAELSGCAKSVHWMPNPINGEHVSGPLNVIRRCTRRTKDSDITRLQWLMIDVDPKKAVTGSDAGATDAEKARAREVADELRADLDAKKFPRPVEGDSGNGFHFFYSIDEPVENSGLIRGVLAALAKKFDTPEVTIDQAVGNPSRLAKVYGTLVCKGENTQERPYRESAVLELPETLEVVPHDLLVALAAEAPAEQPTSVATPGIVNVKQVGVPASDETLRRAGAYLAKIPPAVSQQRGHDRTFHAACVLVVDFDLSPDQAYPLLAEWNETCVPPWSECQLWHKLEGADKKEGPRGHLLHRPALAKCPSNGETPTIAPEGPGRSTYSGRPDDPFRLADSFLAARYREAGVLRLRFWRGEWWRWADGYYRPVPESDLRAELTGTVPDILFDLHGPAHGVNVTCPLVRNVLNALSGRCGVDAEVDQPAWLGAADRHPGADVIAVRNGLLVLAADGAVTAVRSPSPDWFSPVCLPMEYDAAADCPSWKKFLDKNLEGDAERIDLMQEWFGYCLTPDTRLHKFLVFQGAGRNGKSVACAALAALLGGRNVSHVSLDRFGSPFALHPTLGKLANIACEVGDVDRVAEDILKGVSAGDRMTFERKFLGPVQAVPTARLVFATNTLPRLTDKSDGVWERLLLVPFRIQVGPAERVPGMDRADWWAEKGELPGLLNWALAGRRRLTARGQFTNPAVCRAAAAEYREDCDPAHSFLNECCEPAPGQAILKAELRRRYNEWCELYGYKPMNERNFGRAVIRAFPTVDPDGKKKAGPGGPRMNAYLGLRFIH